MLVSVIAFTIAAAPCTRMEVPRDLAGWSRSGRTLDTRHAVTLPTRDGRAETGVRIRSDGVFGVALDRDGWIEVATRGGRKLRMISDHRGPRCSGIRKIVRYRLKPGNYQVTVARVQGPRAKLMLVHGEFARARRRG